MNRDDFKMVSDDLIYFDNGATTLKPYQIINDINEYLVVLVECVKKVEKPVTC